MLTEMSVTKWLAAPTSAYMAMGPVANRQALSQESKSVVVLVGDSNELTEKDLWYVASDVEPEVEIWRQWKELEIDFSDTVMHVEGAVKCNYMCKYFMPVQCPFHFCTKCAAEFWSYIHFSWV